MFTTGRGPKFFQLEDNHNFFEKGDDFNFILVNVRDASSMLLNMRTTKFL